MNKSRYLADIQPGETFRIGGMEFIRFTETAEGIPAVMKDIVFKSEFGDNNDLRCSKIRKRLEEEVLPKLVEAVGEENIREFETDLTTLDGLKPYAPLASRISLPTLDFYRANVAVFDKHEADTWWWLATPESSPPHGSTCWALCVSPSGYVSIVYYFNCYGVRPFCIFNPAIFVS